MFKDREILEFQKFVKPYYNQPRRVYHDHRHVQYMMDKYKAWFSEPISESLWLAITFHDAVYVPGAENNANELASAALVRVAWYDVMGGEMPQELYQDVRSLILETVLSQHMSQYHSSTVAGQRIRDLDLLALSADWETFSNAQRAVRFELAPLGVTEKAHADWLVSLAKARTTGLYLTPELQSSGNHLVAVTNILRYADEAKL